MASALLEEAVKEIGYCEDPPGSNRTKFAKEAGHSNGAPWCASFVVAMARRAGVKLPSESAYTPTMAEGFKKAGLWVTDPRPGDVVFFDFPDSKHRIQHVGIVESVAGSVLTCIEGNTSQGAHGSQDNGGGVYRRKRSRVLAVGFGRPVASEEDDMTPEQSKQLSTIHHHLVAKGGNTDKLLDALGRIEMRLAAIQEQTKKK